MKRLEFTPFMSTVSEVGDCPADHQVQDVIFRECSSCKRETGADPGDVLCGSDWYHLACWESIKKQGERHQEPNTSSLATGDVLPPLEAPNLLV